MAFLTKIALVSLLAASSFALPSPTSDDEALITRTVCSSNIDANFDGLEPPIPLPAPPVLTVLPAPLPTKLPVTANLNIVYTPYKELDWNDGFRFLEGSSIYKSPPNAALFDGVTQELNEARISIYDTVQSFTLKSLYLAGFLQSQGAALEYVPFTLTATGTKTNGQTVSEDYHYTPEGLKQFKLNSFTDLKSVVFESDLLTTLLTAVVIDDVEYTVHKPC